MADLLLGHSSVEEIVARMVADTTAGIDPASTGYPDVVFGSILSDVFGAASLEIDRVYDRVHNELPAAALPDRTFGEWLDAWAVTVGVGNGEGGYGRKGAVAASGVQRFTAGPGLAAVVIPLGTTVSTEAASDDEDEVEFTTTIEAILPPTGGTVDVPIVAADEGLEGVVPANSVTILQTDVDNVASVTNPLATQGGADVESDPALQSRVVKKLRGGGGPGNPADYENKALEQPGVGFVTVERNWNGVGTVRVIVTDPQNDPASTVAVDTLQQEMDPLDGSPGWAPIGATVTVTTAVSLAVTVSADVTTEGGYSLTGTGGTRPLADDIETALRAYIDRLPPGADVIRAEVIGAIVSVVGVLNVDVTAPAADVAVTALQVPSLTTLNLT